MTLAMTFSRMNPIHIGHMKVVDTINSQDADEYRVYLSHSEDSKKNPIPYRDKVFYCKELIEKQYPRVEVMESEARTVIEVLVAINEEFSDIIMVVGGDRIDAFDQLLQAYNGKPNKAGQIPYHYDSITVVSAGDRDPDAEGAEGVSASKMREFAKNNDFESFAKGIPSQDVELIQAIYGSVREGMGLV